MAVRRVRSDVSGTTIALIVFVFIAVIAIALSVMFYLGRTKAERSLADVSAELESYARAEERSNPTTQKALESAKNAKEPRSLVSQLITQNNAYRGIIGTSAADPEATQKEFEGRKVKLPLSTALTGLAAENANAKKQLAAAQDAVKQREAELKAAQDEIAKVKESTGKTIADLTASLDAIKQAQQGFDATTTEKLTGIEKRIEEVQAAADKRVAGYENQIKVLQTQIVKLKLRNDDYARRIRQDAPEMPDPTKEADGRIIATDPDRNLVYINLGRGDHLVLGMTFEVFDAQRGVQVDKDGKPRGVASIEVTEIGDKSATARVVRSTAGRPALVNDIIANQVYDRDRHYKFYVFGEFDLDGDGNYTMADHDMIVDMIKRWGGEVVKPSERARQLSASLGKDAADASLMPIDTDFLIIGKEPELPRPLPPGETDPARIRESIEQKRRWDQYIQLVNEAKSLAVPILNQNRFLTLIGYYRR